MESHLLPPQEIGGSNPSPSTTFALNGPLPMRGGEDPCKPATLFLKRRNNYDRIK